jgi:ribosomal protein S18 acetylase RimI-like enzyme
MEITTATTQDAMAIARVHVLSWQSAYPGLLPQAYLDGLRPEDRLGGWENALAGAEWPRSGILTLVDSDEIVGFSHVCPTRDEDRDPTTTGEITSIYLAPQAWGSGNGAALISAAIAQMVEAGYETATLWALDTNTRARRFYEIGGWTADGTTKIHDWGTFRCTDVRYVLPLSGESKSLRERS